VNTSVEQKNAGRREVKGVERLKSSTNSLPEWKNPSSPKREEGTKGERRQKQEGRKVRNASAPNQETSREGVPDKADKMNRASGKCGLKGGNVEKSTAQQLEQKQADNKIEGRKKKENALQPKRRKIEVSVGTRGFIGESHPLKMRVWGGTPTRGNYGKHFNGKKKVWSRGSQKNDFRSGEWKQRGLYGTLADEGSQEGTVKDRVLCAGVMEE